MIDTRQTLDLLKIRFYNDYLNNTHIYSEGESEMHRVLTEKIVKEIIDPLLLPADAGILDLGCGPGYFLDEMKTRGFQRVMGVTLSDEDVKHCLSKGHNVKKYDLSFLPQDQGFYDDSVDFIFLRHALEHSPYPVFSLLEYNRLLKQNSYMYIETPAPDCARLHEYNANHYSILGKTQIAALLIRTGFEIDKFKLIDFELTETHDDGTTKQVPETYYSFLVKKKFHLDLK